jgi:SAM-dependent methyltransferase
VSVLLAAELARKDPIGACPRWEVVKDWKRFWNEYPLCIDEADFLRQVCHTIDGRPYTSLQFDALIYGIRQGLRLGPTSSLLDVCCGNGAVTTALAIHCKQVVGVDFSIPLINIARKFHGAPNTRFLDLDALELMKIDVPEAPFDKVMMYGALQHFDVEDLDCLISGLLKHGATDCTILLGGVPDKARLGQLFNTPDKLRLHQTYRREGRDVLGTWWDSNVIRDACRRFGLDCRIDNESSDRPGGHYRFDAWIS